MVLKCLPDLLTPCSGFVQIMAVPFVQDWDLVQTLGEGAYGEWVSIYQTIWFLSLHRLLTLQYTTSDLISHSVFQGPPAGQQEDWGGSGGESCGHVYCQGLYGQREERGVCAQDAVPPQYSALLWAQEWGINPLHLPGVLQWRRAVRSNRWEQVYVLCEVMSVCLTHSWRIVLNSVTEPDVGMPEKEAHRFFQQLIAGVVSSTIFIKFFCLFVFMKKQL